MIVDRIEGELAVVELDKGKFVDIPVEKISGRVRDGAVLVKGAAGREGDRPAGTPCRIAPRLTVRERAPLSVGTARDFRLWAARRHPTMAVPGIPGIPRSSLAPPALS